jgi:tetratricopeptide (TPR) repeat protein
MRRHLNLKAFLVLVLALAVLTTGAYFVHGYQLTRNADALLAQATREQEAGHTPEALGYLDAYLHFRPRDDEARERFAKILGQSSQRVIELERVQHDLERVLQAHPERFDLLSEAAAVAMRRGRPDEALIHLEKLRKHSPADTDVLDQLARAQEQLLRFPAAAKDYQDAVKHDPHRISCYVALAYLLQTRLDEHKTADAVIEEMRKANKGSSAALIAWARYQMAFKGVPEHEQAMKEVLELARRPRPDPDALLLAADMELARNQADGARQLLRRGLEQKPTDFGFLHALARVEVVAGRRGAALDYLHVALKHMPGDVTALASTADLLIDAGAADEAEELTKSVERDQRSSGVLHYIAARIDMADEHWAAALNKFRLAREGLAAWPDLIKQSHLLAAECYRQLDDPDQALASCQEALKIDPTWLPGQLRQAAAVQAMGRTEQAAQLYTELAGRSTGAALEAAGLWLALANNPTQREGAARAATALLEDGVPKQERGTARYKLLRVQLLAAKNDPKGAAREAKAATTAFPGDPALWLAHAALANLEQGPEEVSRLLTAAEKVAGDHAAIRLARLRQLQIAGKLRELDNLLASYKERDNFLASNELWEFALPPGEQAQWLRGLAALHVARGDRTAALEVLTRLAAERKSDIGVRAALLEVLLAKPEPQRLGDLVKDLRGLEGDDGTWWRFAEAARLLNIGRADARSGLDEARGLLAVVIRRRPGWSAPLVLDGMIYEREGNTDGAIGRYQQALDLGDRRPDLVRRLVGLYFRNRRFADAQAVMNRAQQAGRPGVMGRLAAEAALFADAKPKEALELARQAVAPRSKDYQDHLWLGQILWRLQKTAEAEKDRRRAAELGAEAETELRNAAELGKDHPETWVTLVAFLAADNRREQARQVIAEASATLAPDAAPLALAACWEAAGDRKEAARHYSQALAARPDDPAMNQAMSQFELRCGELDQAQVHLRKILDARDRTPAQEAWARRTLAVVLASGGNYQRTNEALELLKANGAPAPADQRALALILARRPGGRGEAIRKLEAAFLKVPPTDQERYLLASLYVANRDWQRGREQFLRLLTGSPAPNPAYVAAFVLLLTQQGELADAAHWLSELEKQQPHELRTAFLQARLLKARKEGDRALPLLRAAAQEGTADPARQLAVGRILEDLGFAAEAEPYYRAFAQARARETPAAQVALIGHLGRRNRLTEALDLCEQLRAKKVSDESMAPVWVGCLRAGTPEAEHCRRVDGWLQAAVKREPGKLLFELALANLRDLEGQTDEAVKAYDHVLQQDPNNVLALNNLSVLLAFRGQARMEVLGLIERAIELSGPVPGLLDSRGIVHLSLGQWEQAKNDLEEVANSEPAPASYFRLARAYYELHDLPHAKSALEKAYAADGKVEKLHPLERPAYEELVNRLAKN